MRELHVLSLSLSFDISLNLVTTAQDYKATQKLAQDRESNSLPRPNPLTVSSKGALSPRAGTSGSTGQDLERGLMAQDAEIEKQARSFSLGRIGGKGGVMNFTDD
jgi:hypothetical protein